MLLLHVPADIFFDLVGTMINKQFGDHLHLCHIQGLGDKTSLVLTGK